MNDGFYIIDLPAITRKNGKHKTIGLSPNQTTYLHGDGCNYASHCRECPLLECKHVRRPTKQEVMVATNRG